MEYQLNRRVEEFEKETEGLGAKKVAMNNGRPGCTQ
jgi:hypothetical protein